MFASHNVILGATGSGKTSFALMLASVAPRLIVLDTSHDPLWDYTGPSYYVPKKAADFFMENLFEDFQMTFRPSSERDALRFVQMVYDFQSTGDLPPIAVVVEESGLFSSSHSIPSELENAISRGRRAGLSVISIAQAETQINPHLRRMGMITISLRQKDPPASTAKQFQNYIDVLPNLETLDPFTRPEYGTHYVTSPPNEDPFRSLARAMVNPGTQNLPPDYRPPI